MNPNQPEASGSRPRAGPSGSSPFSPLSSSTSASSSSDTIYTFSQHPEHTDPSFRPSPIDAGLALSSAPNLREAPNADIIPPVRPTLAQFRQSEGPEVRSGKLKSLWETLPTLPSLHDEEGESETKRMKLPGQDTMTALSPERADRLRRLYEEELVRRCNEDRPQARLWGGPDNQGEKWIGGKGVRFEAFRRFLWDQESHLWDMFQELDKNGDGRLDATEMRAALSRAGIDITPATVTDLVRFLASGAEQKGMGVGEGGNSHTANINARDSSLAGGAMKGAGAGIDTKAGGGGSGGAGAGSATGKSDMYITFAEFRDFLIMLPREATPFEIYKFYQVRKRSSDGRGAARVDKEGDINISFPKRPPTPPPKPASGSASGSGSGSGSASLSSSAAGTAGMSHSQNQGLASGGDDEDDGYEDQVADTDTHAGGGSDAWRFLLAGGIAGAVSRSVTAPFDRLKVYLITTGNTHIDPLAARPSSLTHPLRTSTRAIGNLWAAMGRIYADGGGVRAFWVGNGLNVMKIFPESAIKFVSYEHSKVLLAQYWDNVSDVSELSSSSRFFAGGVGGITSQFSIYGLETLKTRIQTDLGPASGMKGVGRTVREMWAAGGIRVFYRGLTLGLIGVFPYSAIDMGTYETLKRAYCRSTGKDEPEVIATLGFGALSGSIGAASVYPINLLRTRLQASGSSGHPQKYTGFRDVLSQTLAKEGWRGLYKGLLPSILKVGPAVGVSWIVYEDAKRRLGAGQ